METLTIQLTNQKSYRLLQELEELHLIRILHNNDSNTPPPGKTLSDKFASKLPAFVAEDLQRHITQSRNEWNRDI